MLVVEINFEFWLYHNMWNKSRGRNTFWWQCIASISQRCGRLTLSTPSEPVVLQHSSPSSLASPHWAMSHHCALNMAACIWFCMALQTSSCADLAQSVCSRVVVARSSAFGSRSLGHHVTYCTTVMLIGLQAADALLLLLLGPGDIQPGLFE